MLLDETIFLVIVLVTAGTVQAIPNNCSAQYQTALQQVLNIKKNCEEVVYKDCCEVRFTPFWQ